MEALILLVVKALELIPLSAQCELQPPEAVQNCKVEITRDLPRIPEGNELSLESSLEGGPGPLGGEFEANHEEGAHEEGRVGLLIEGGARVVEDPDTLVPLVLQDAVELYAIPVQLGQVQWPEVLVVTLVDQHLVNVEEEGVRHILWRVFVAVPIETV